jgi:PRMT5 oligomerisation domain
MFAVSSISYGRYTFKAKLSAMMHGFVGYFEAWLYKDITISASLQTPPESVLCSFIRLLPLRPIRHSPKDVQHWNVLLVPHLFPAAGLLVVEFAACKGPL